MTYTSTRDKNVLVTSAGAIVKGISSDGGLFVPTEFPTITSEEIVEIGGLSYAKAAAKVIGKFLSDFFPSELDKIADAAYNSGKFESKDVIKLRKLDESIYMLELWHGPTSAFKDMALQILPYLLVASGKLQEVDKKFQILVATSGDTGKAALDGFSDVPGTGIAVFYPEGGVSDIQRLQMTTQSGENVQVAAIRGNFDDAQTAVKKVFTDTEINKKLNDNGTILSSANSINWGRLVPQIVYYVASYAKLVKDGEITEGDAINICVPTGNFGNILAAYYAKQMGLPVNKFICASNSNNILTDFITTGVYDRNRPFYQTISPSMDILISSNLERLLFHLSDGNAEEVKGLFDQLNSDGKYEVSPEIFEKLSTEFYADYASEDKTARTIRDAFVNYGYFADPHTAVALNVYERYVEHTGDATKTIIASTASPYKFSDSVLRSLGYTPSKDTFKNLVALSRLSNIHAPKALFGLNTMEERFSEVIDKEEIPNFVSNLQ